MNVSVNEKRGGRKRSYRWVYLHKELFQKSPPPPPPPPQSPPPPNHTYTYTPPHFHTLLFPPSHWIMIHHHILLPTLASRNTTLTANIIMIFVKRKYVNDNKRKGLKLLQLNDLTMNMGAIIIYIFKPLFLSVKICWLWFRKWAVFPLIFVFYVLIKLTNVLSMQLLYDVIIVMVSLNLHKIWVEIYKKYFGKLVSQHMLPWYSMKLITF